MASAIKLCPILSIILQENKNRVRHLKQSTRVYHGLKGEKKKYKKNLHGKDHREVWDFLGSGLSVDKSSLKKKDVCALHLH